MVKSSAASVSCRVKADVPSRDVGSPKTVETEVKAADETEARAPELSSGPRRGPSRPTSLPRSSSTDSGHNNGSVLERRDSIGQVDEVTPDLASRDSTSETAIQKESTSPRAEGPHNAEPDRSEVLELSSRPTPQAPQLATPKAPPSTVLGKTDVQSRPREVQEQPVRKTTELEQETPLSPRPPVRRQQTPRLQRSSSQNQRDAAFRVQSEIRSRPQENMIGARPEFRRREPTLASMASVDDAQLATPVVQSLDEGDLALDAAPVLSIRPSVG